MSNEQYNFVLGALATIDRKVDIMSENFQEIKIDIVHMQEDIINMQEDIDEALTDIYELKQYNNMAINQKIEDEIDDLEEFEEEFDI